MAIQENGSNREASSPVAGGVFENATPRLRYMVRLCPCSDRYQRRSRLSDEVASALMKYGELPMAFSSLGSRDASRKPIFRRQDATWGGGGGRVHRRRLVSLEGKPASRTAKKSTPSFRGYKNACIVLHCTVIPQILGHKKM